jgi:hypothetical protein
MPKISTYPVVTPASNDLLIVTDASDSNATKNVTISSLSSLVSYSEIYDSSAGEVTAIASQNSFVLLNATTTQGNSNDVSLTTNSLGRITNTGASRTFYVTYYVSASSSNNQNLLFRIHVNGAAVAHSESDTITSSGGKASSVSNAAIITLATNQYVEIYVANATAANNVTLEHFNLIMRQL